MNKENLNPSEKNKQNVHPERPTSAGARKPLGDISTGNRVPSLRKTVKSTIIIIKSKESVEIARNGAVETKINYSTKIKKKSELEDENGKVCSEAEVFESGVDHYVRNVDTDIHDSGRSTESEEYANSSQVVPVARVDDSEADEDLFRDHLYNDEYFEDNYEYMLNVEDNFVCPKEAIIKCIDQKYRTALVNWLNNVHRTLRLTEETFFMAIRIFDHMAIVSKLSSKRYNLVGLTCMWIASKYYDYRIKASTLAKMVNYYFSAIDITTEEKKILQELHFQLHFPEPSTFLFYYLKQQHLETNSKVRWSALFLLEIFTLMADFSSFPPSILAAVALHQVIVGYSLEEFLFLEYINVFLIDKTVFSAQSEQLSKRLNCILNCKAACSEIVEKYSSKEKCYVAMNFFSN